MVNVVTGLIALAGVLAFFGFYLLRIESWVLSLISVGVLALAATDVVISLRRGGGDSGAQVDE